MQRIFGIPRIFFFGSVIEMLGGSRSVFDAFYVLTVPGSEQLEGVRKDLKGHGVFTVFVHYGQNSGLPNTDKNKRSILFHSGCNGTCANIREGHLAMIRDAQKRNFRNVVFMEDDARFSSDLERVIRGSRDWIAAADWDILFLGHCPWPMVFALPTSNRYVKKVFTPLLAHCYALSAVGRAKVLAVGRKSSEQIDKILGGSFPLLESKGSFGDGGIKRYALYPSVSFQCVDPAKYRQLGLPFSFERVNRAFEHLAVGMPFIIGLACICVVLIIAALLCGLGTTAMQILT